MIVQTINRMARGLDYPDLVGPNSISIASDVAVPGTAWQNASYGLNGLNGLGDVLTDITTGNWASLPTDFVTGLNPSTFDIGSYLLLGGALWLFMGKKKGKTKGKGSASAKKKAELIGSIAQYQALLKDAS